jgi:hypothetical protein
LKIKEYEEYEEHEEHKEYIKYINEAMKLFSLSVRQNHPFAFARLGRYFF